MGNEYTFYDYIDENGNNVIMNWLNGEARDAKVFFGQVIPHLEATPPPWSTKYVKYMRTDWKGFIELRKTGTIQYRLLCQMRNRDVYIVATGFHKGKYYPTDVPPEIAAVRVSQMIANPAKYRRTHEYN